MILEAKKTDFEYKNGDIYILDSDYLSIYI